MKTLALRSIRQRILMWGGICLLIVAAGIIGYAAVSMNSLSYANVVKDLSGKGETNAVPVKYQFDEALSAVSAVSETFSGIKENNLALTSPECDAILERFLTGHPNCTGVYAIWEPAAFDGRSDHENSYGFDKEGKFQTWWIRSNGTVIRGTFVADDIFGQSDYYDIPKKTLKPVVTEPYTDKDTKQLMTSVSSPIIINGKFAGIVGTDITLDTLSQQADQVSGYDNTLREYLVSNQGMLVGASGDHSQLGKNLKTIENLSGSLSGGELHEVLGTHTSGVALSNGTLIAITPYTIGTLEQPWSVVLTVPEEKATAEARNITIMMILIGMLLTVLGLVLLSYSSKKISGPIQEITRISGQIAEGDTNVPLTIRSDDEIGELADSFRTLEKGLKAKAEAASAIARGDLDVTIPVASDKDTLGAAMGIMHSNISRMTTGVNRLAEAAIAGDLTVQVENDGLEGEFGRIISGINATLDAVIRPINGAMELAEAYASGDYTVRFDPSIPVSGAFLSFRDALNDIGEKNGSAVRAVKGEMDSMASELQETATSIHEISTGSGHLAQSATQVSSLADVSLNGVHQILEAMDLLSKKIMDVAGMAERVASVSGNTDELSKEGTAMARHAEEGMVQITTSIRESSQMMEEISMHMNEIETIVNLIRDIADQTNLLALNAAIEAARAGEAGMGFAVVADEVKALAVESRVSAEKIAEMITNLQKRSSDASQAMARSSREVADGNQAVSDTMEVFSQIVTHVQEISSSALEVSKATADQAAAVEEITAGVHELESHLTQTTDEAASSAAATEETSAALDQITSSVTSISHASEHIKNEMDNFSV